MKKTMTYIILLLAIFSVLLFPEDRGKIVRRKSSTGLASSEGIYAGKQYLFLVAIDRYDQWSPLRGPVGETIALKKILETKYHIDEVKELYNEDATNEAIKKHLISLQEGKFNELKENDTLMIYFSGHGQSFEAEGRNGYWIPYNGSNDSSARSYWINNSEISGLLKSIKSNHILIVSDSCFAGTLLDTSRGEDEWESNKEYLHRFYNRRARKVLTSGGFERVPGKSIFARYFRNELEGNRKPWIRIKDIHEAIDEEVFKKTKKLPEFGNLKETDFDPSASFILFTREGWDKLVRPHLGIVDWRHRRAKEISQFETTFRETVKWEKEGKLYLKNREIKEKYKKISADFFRYFDDFKKDRELQAIIRTINQKIQYYSNRPDFVDLRIRVHPYASVYIDGEFIGEVPPQKIKRNLREEKNITLKLVKDGQEYSAEFYVRSNQVHWITEITDLMVTLTVIE